MKKCAFFLALFMFVSQVSPCVAVDATQSSQKPKTPFEELEIGRASCRERV